LRDEVIDVLLKEAVDDPLGLLPRLLDPIVELAGEDVGRVVQKQTPFSSMTSGEATTCRFSLDCLHWGAENDW
jgi:hypothetical protein